MFPVWFAEVFYQRNSFAQVDDAFRGGKDVSIVASPHGVELRQLKPVLLTEFVFTVNIQSRPYRAAAPAA